MENEQLELLNKIENHKTIIEYKNLSMTERLYLIAQELNILNKGAIEMDNIKFEIQYIWINDDNIGFYHQGKFFYSWYKNLILNT